MKRVVRCLSVLYLVALLVLWGGIYFDTGAWWPVALFLFSPRWLVAVPLLLLVPLTLAADLRMTAVYLVHGAIILFCLLGYHLSWNRPFAPVERPVLRVLTCNVGGGANDERQLGELVRRHSVDVLILQECGWQYPSSLFEELGWAERRERNVVFGSRFELGETEVVARHDLAHYKAEAAVACDLYLPPVVASGVPDGEGSDKGQTIRLVNVHFPTFRPALEEATRFNRSVGPVMLSISTEYTEVVAHARQEVDKTRAATLVAGDFNVPVESAFYRNFWSDFQNAFSTAGTGLGYTKFTRYHGVRIDHVLADEHWTVVSAAVLEGMGGDHRPVLAELVLNEPGADAE